MKYICAIFCLLLLSHNGRGQDSIQVRLILVGDAGQLLKGKQPVISAVRNNMTLDENTTVLYVGDNLYPAGLSMQGDINYNVLRASLDTQMNVAKGTKAKVIFIPGNHDWGNGSRDGLDKVLREQRYLFDNADPNVTFFPQDGCPGPVAIDLSPDVELVIIDSQWWLHPFVKPGIESDCDCKTKDELISSLEDILAKNSRKLVILACHHPMRSNGIHGGFFPLKSHIFPFTDYFPSAYIPLPIIGSIYPIARGVFGTPQDLKHPNYTQMRKEIGGLAKKHPNLIFVSGHEHNLQLLKDSTNYFIISGAGSKHTRVSANKNSDYVAEQYGFATLEISKNKNVRVDYYEIRDTGMYHAHTQNLLNFSKIPEKFLKDTATGGDPAFTYKDSVTVPADSALGGKTGFKRFMLGENYRKEWTTPVTFKVFRIKQEKGGFTVQSLGGGKQTKSLRLMDTKGKEWTLRTVEKDQEGELPENLRATIAQDIVQDLLSASHPYAALAVPTLAKAVGVVVATPTYYYVPDDPNFNSFYRPLFAGKVCLLEEREPTPDNKSKSTGKVIGDMLDDNDNHTDQEAVLRARLLDILIGDWDRHFDQWKFGTSDTGKGKLYYPIPRDRDQAFFYSDGRVVKKASQNNLRYLKGFTKDIQDINWFMYQGRDFDRIFMSNLDEEKWKNITNDFVAAVPDPLITSAVQKMPPAIFALNGETIINKMKSRRDQLPKLAMTYYKFLSKDVDVLGSNKREIFKVTAAGKGFNVKVFKLKKAGTPSSLMYDRTFDPAVTKEVRLYGFNDNDVFDIDEKVDSKIKIRIIGGGGSDTFNLKGNVHSIIYDFKNDSNYIQNSRKASNEMSNDPLINNYDPINFQYNFYRFPKINFGYNIEDKLFLGIGFIQRTYAFRKSPWSTNQKANVLYAPYTGSFQVKYQGEFNEILGKNDLLFNGELVSPSLNNFFGLGNETKISPSHNLDYYRVRYTYLNAEVMMRKRFNNVLNFLIGPTVFSYRTDYKDNKDRILGHPSQIGLDSLSVYTSKTYIGGKFGIVINNVNSDLLPTRGVLWDNEFSSESSVSGGKKNLTKLTSDMTVYSSLKDSASLVTVLRFGWGKIFTDKYEYFQALSLGTNNFLRGFRKNRFSGSKIAYQSIEARIRLMDSKSYILPGPFGLILFNEVGKVWVEGVKSKKWHDSYGAGLYFAPYNIAIISATIGISDEERLFNFSLGTKFNLTF